MIQLVYIAGPYTAPHPYQVDVHIQAARCVALKVAQLGAMPVTPHMMSAHFDGIGDYAFWIEATLTVMLRCDAVLMMDTWASSKGATGEHDKALELGLPVFYSLQELREWLDAESTRFALVAR